MGFGPALGEGVINTPHSSVGWSDRWVFAGEHLNRRAEELRILSALFWISGLIVFAGEHLNRRAEELRVLPILFQISGLIVFRSGWIAALAEELIILCPLGWKGC